MMHLARSLSMSERAGSEPEVLSISFNQDATCACIASRTGISVYSFECSKVVFMTDVGSIRLCRMLFSTSLLAYVGSGLEVNLSPRKLVLLNTKDQQVIDDLKFKSAVLAVRLNKKRLVAVLQGQAKVYALESLELLNTIETSDNPQGVCAMTSGPETCLLALPSQSGKGSIQISNTLADGQAVADIQAHKGALAAIAFSESGSLMASASDTGTVIRVHSLPRGLRTHQLRRGSTSATINCLTFYSDNALTLLACTSSHGTVHIWRLEDLRERGPSGLLSSVMPTAMNDLVEPQRCLINLRVPNGVPTECALKRSELRDHASEESSSDRAPNDATNQSIDLLLVTKSAVLYRYRLQGMTRSDNSSSLLLSEHSLLGGSESIYQ